MVHIKSSFLFKKPVFIKLYKQIYSIKKIVKIYSTCQVMTIKVRAIVMMQKKKFKFSISYNRCCKPIPVEYKCSAKNLRSIPIDLVDKWNAKYIDHKLTSDHRICQKCKDRIREACESSQESSESNFLFIVFCCFICT